MKCERSVMVITLYWYSSQVFSLGNCIDDTLRLALVVRVFSDELPTSLNG